MNYETHSRYFSEVPGEPKPKLFSPNAIALAKKFWQGAAGNVGVVLKSEFRNSKLKQKFRNSELTDPFASSRLNRGNYILFTLVIFSIILAAQ